MKKYILLLAITLVSVHPWALYEKENYTISHDLFFICSFIRSSETNLHGLLP